MFTAQKMTLNLQLQQDLGVKFPQVLWLSRDHFGLPWASGVLRVASMLTSGSCVSDTALYLLGLASNVVPMFLGEMAPRNLRGAIGVVPQLFITVGILVAQILGLNSILGNAEGKALPWRFCVLYHGKISHGCHLVSQAGLCCWGSLASHHSSSSLSCPFSLRVPGTC